VQLNGADENRGLHQVVSAGGTIENKAAGQAGIGAPISHGSDDVTVAVHRQIVGRDIELMGEMPQSVRSAIVDIALEDGDGLAGQIENRAQSLRVDRENHPPVGEDRNPAEGQVAGAFGSVADRRQDIDLSVLGHRQNLGPGAEDVVELPSFFTGNGLEKVDEQSLALALGIGTDQRQVVVDSHPHDLGRGRGR
jgi:hypothetical protein